MYWLNVPCMFQSTFVIKTGLSDSDLMAVTVVRKTFKEIRPRVISYRYQVKLIFVSFHHETITWTFILLFHGDICLIKNGTLIKMVQFWFTDKKLNPAFSTFLSKFTLPKTSYFFAIFSLHWKCKRINSRSISSDDFYG